MKPESTSKASLLKQIQILLSFIFFSYVFLKHKRDLRLIYLLTVFIFLQIHLNSPCCQKASLKIKVFNKIQFFTLEFIHTCDNLISYCFNYLQMNNKYFLDILLTLSGDISLNQVIGTQMNGISLDQKESS